MIPQSDPELRFHRKMAANFFNETWTLLDKPARTTEEDALMIHMAHASRLHWQFVGTAENFSIGEWQISRVHALLGQFDSALYHGQRSLEIAEESALSPFLRACAHEAIARALASAHPEATLEHIAIARKIASQITEAEEKETIEKDLASIAIDQIAAT